MGTSFHRSTLAAIVLTVLPSALHADTWVNYGTRVCSSPSGSHYVIVDGTAFDGRYCGRASSVLHLVRRAAGCEPVEERRVSTKMLPAGGAIGLVEAGDELLASTPLDQTPLRTEVLDDGRVVVIDSYASMGYGELAIVIAADGTVVRSLDPTNVFENFSERYRGSVSNLRWLTVCWVDHERNELLLVLKDHEVRAFDLVTGSLAERDLQEALFSPSGPTEEPDRCRQWELAITQELRVGRTAWSVAEDPDQPLSVRVRAAVAVGLEDPAGARDLLLEGLRSDDRTTSRWCWSWLGRTLGPESLPIYREAIQGSMRVEMAMAEGMAHLGDAAVPIVIDMLLTPGAGSEGEWNPPRVMALLESEWSITGKIPFLAWGDDVVALTRLRDLGETARLATLLTRKKYHSRGAEVHCFLALPSLEQVRRAPSLAAAEHVARYLDLLHTEPHRMPAWNQRLHRAAVAALSACEVLRE